MKFTTRFRPSDIGAAILIAFIGMFFTSVVNAGTCEGGYIKTFEWVAPTEREDDTTLKPGEIDDFKIYYGDKVGEYGSTHLVKDKTARSADVGLAENTDCYAVITTIDTGGRESKQSKVITVNTGEPAPQVLPSPIADLVIKRSGTSDNEFVFSFTAIDTDTNGDPLTPTVYYLFNAETDKWIQNVHYSKVPFILTLPSGINKFNTETEGMINSVREVSERSETVTVDVTDYVPPPPVITRPKVIEVFMPKEGLVIKVTPE